MPRVQKGLKEQALNLLRQKFPPTEVFKSIGGKVSLQTLYKWEQELLSPGIAASTPNQPVSPDAGAPQLFEQPKGPELEELAAEHEPLPFAGWETGSQNETPPVQAPIIETTPQVPAMDAKALMAVVKMVKAGFIQMAAMGWGITLEDSHLDALSNFTPLEEQQLEVLAPYAAEYTPLVNTYAKPAMAILFLGVVSMSTARSFSELKKLKPEKPNKKDKGKK